MADFPSLISAQRLTQQGLSSTFNGTSLVANLTANVEGAWTEIVASSTHDADGILLCIRDGTGANGLIDIGTGASGSEVERMTDVPIAHSRSFFAQAIYCPIPIPAGSRIAGRYRSDVASAQVRVTIMLIKGGFLNLGPMGSLRQATYGVSTANSQGTQIDPGGTAHTKSAWVQLVASTAIPLKYLFMLMSNQRNTTDANEDILADIGVGAASSERIVVPDIWFHGSTVSDTHFPMWIGPFPVDLPGSVRLAMRAQSSIIDATDRLMDVALVGFG